MAGSRLGTAYVQIIPSAQGIGGKIKEALSGEADSAGIEAGNKVGSGLVGKIKTAIAAAGIGAALKAAIGEGAALEQSLGGVETLFKSSADTVVNNAKNAFKTAGLSANEYMENVTSFSASLLSGLGGDTAKAADIANRAMTDMSDNSNKMGTSMQDIMNAYQGFAKDNYTMLDNLKLGYGGTQEEMARLINDTGVLGDTFVTTGQKGNFNDVVTFDKVIEAIGIVQDRLGITGTTAKEAESTISGSFNAMKASAQNFAGYLALGMDITPAINNLVSTASTFLFGNLFPAIGNVIVALPGAISTFVTTAAAEISQNFSLSMISNATNSAVDFINSLATGLSTNIPVLLAQALPMILQLSENLRANAGQLVDAGLNLILQLAQGIANSLPTLITYIPLIVTNIAGIINDNAPKLIVTAGQILLVLAQGLIAAIPSLVAAIPSIIQAIVAVFSAFNWMSLGKQAVTAIKNGILALRGAVASAGTNIMQAIVNALMSLPSRLLALGRSGISGLASGIRGAAGQVASGITSIISKIISLLSSVPSKVATIGRQIVQGIANGIRNAASAVVNALTNVVNNAINAVKRKLGIASPSRVFRDQVGKWIPAGIAVGISKYSDSAVTAVEKMSAKLTETAIPSLQSKVMVAAETQFDKRTNIVSAGRASMSTDAGAKNVYLTYAPVQSFDEPVTLAQREAINRRDTRRIERMLRNA